MMTISNAQLIYDKLLETHPDSMQSITQLSYNDADQANFIESDVEAFNYDSVTNAKAENPKKEKSPDALFCADNILYFVEFKEGQSNKTDIRLKIHEGITTLFNFCRQHLPELPRADFFDLDIRYAVVIRQKQNHPDPSFADTLEMSSKKYDLKNLEGFIINKTRVIYQPSTLVKLLEKITSGVVDNITIHNHQGTERLEVRSA
jgi:hypothetical protein